MSAQVSVSMAWIRSFVRPGEGNSSAKTACETPVWAHTSAQSCVVRVKVSTGHWSLVSGILSLAYFKYVYIVAVVSLFFRLNNKMRREAALILRLNKLVLDFQEVLREVNVRVTTTWRRRSTRWKTLLKDRGLGFARAVFSYFLANTPRRESWHRHVSPVASVLGGWVMNTVEKKRVIVDTYFIYHENKQPE